MTDWQIHPRNADLSRTFDPISGWESLVLVERYNSPDSWTVTGPASALSVFAPGMGCILDRDGTQVTSGQVESIRRAATTQSGRSVDTMTVAFASDLAALGWRDIRPTPGQALTGALTTFPDAYDLRTGARETLILGYIASHLGGSALTDRRLSRLRVPATLGRGGSQQVSARFDDLGVQVQTLAELAGLRLRIVHTEDAGGPWLDLTVTAVADLSDDVRFGTADSTAAGLITDWEYEISAPTATRAVVAIGGEKEVRQFLEVRDTAAETLWSRVVETFVDQRHIATDSADKLTEATAAGQEALVEGAGPVAVRFTPVLGPDLDYWAGDIRLGDTVGYDLPGLDPAEDKIREATTVVQVSSGEATERVSVVVGTPDAPATRTQRQVSKALRAATAIQRSQ